MLERRRVGRIESVIGPSLDHFSLTEKQKEEVCSNLLKTYWKDYSEVIAMAIEDYDYELNDEQVYTKLWNKNYRLNNWHKLFTWKKILHEFWSPARKLYKDEINESKYCWATKNIVWDNMFSHDYLYPEKLMWFDHRMEMYMTGFTHINYLKNKYSPPKDWKRKSLKEQLTETISLLLPKGKLT